MIADSFSLEPDKSSDCVYVYVVVQYSRYLPMYKNKMKSAFSNTESPVLLFLKLSFPDLSLLTLLDCSLE